VDFRWIQWNTDHIAEHGISPQEAEYAVTHAKRPYPRRREDDKWLVRGRGSGGRLIQVIFVLDDDGTAFVIHARPLTELEKRRFRRETKR
jgi:hypothetical protein